MKKRILLPAEKIYIAGPMTGYPKFNFPAFFAAEKRLKERGHKAVLNPARNFDGRTDLPREEYFREDFKMLVQARGIVFLNGWRKSAGALAEYAAAVQLGLVGLDEDFLFLGDESILEEADRLVSGDRNSSYGHPFEDFSRTGRLWATVLQKWAEEDPTRPIPPELVGLCMIQLKISRECHKHKRDNLVDIAGYAKTTKLVQDAK